MTSEDAGAREEDVLTRAERKMVALAVGIWARARGRRGPSRKTRPGADVAKCREPALGSPRALRQASLSISDIPAASSPPPNAQCPGAAGSLP